ncbi:MAG: cytochrome c3 family protein [Candidatus Krumholzibacteriia bacterium]
MRQPTLARPLGAHLLLLLLLLAASAGAGDRGAIRAHADTACNRCHGTVRASLGGLPTGEAAPANGDRDRECRSCHGTVAHQAGLFGIKVADRGARCGACHQFHRPEVIATAVGDVDMASFTTGARAHCRSCHAPGVSLADLGDGHRAAARLYHAAGADLVDISPSEACLRCHERGSSSPWRAAAATLSPSFDDHRSHPVGIDVVPGAGDEAVSIRRTLDPRLPLFDGKVECQTCHHLAAATRHRMISFATPKDLCLGCHEFKRGAGGRDAATLVATADRR